jgi:hypothetical protein
MNLANGTPDFVFSMMVDDVGWNGVRERQHRSRVKAALAAKKQPRPPASLPQVLTLIKPPRPVAEV